MNDTVVYINQPTLFDKISNVFTRMDQTIRTIGKTVTSFCNSRIRTVKFAISMYKTIRRMGMNITSFYREENLIIFTYTTGVRRPFDYMELLQLQQIIDPKQEIIPGETSVYPIPWGNRGVYTLYINIPTWAK